MKVFISMPMNSKSVNQVRVEMGKVFKYIKGKIPEAELIDSIIEGADKRVALEGDDIGVWYLGESIKLMSEANIVFFVNDWKKYRGCAIENEVAKAYGKFCVEINITI